MFPKMNENFAAFVAPAKNERSGWFPVLGILLIVVFYAEFTALVIVLIQLFISTIESTNLGFNAIMTQLAKAETPLRVVMVLTTFFGMLGAICLTGFVLRDKSPMTLIGKGPVLRNLLITMVVFGMITGMGTIIAHQFFELTPNLGLFEWVKWLPLALPLLFVQISAEELIFRGFLQQELAARFQSPFIWMLVPSLVFGALHWDAETFGANAWLIVATTTLFGLFAADITARTGNLGAALGMHFTNNFFAMFVTSMQGNMNGLALYLTPFGADDVDAVRGVLLMDIGLVLLTYTIYLVVIHLKRDG